MTATSTRGITVVCSGSHGCGATWRGYVPEHCTVCHETFSVTSAGDKHRRDGKCLPPYTVGLRRNAKGIWSLPGTGYKWVKEVPDADAQP